MQIVIKNILNCFPIVRPADRSLTFVRLFIKKKQLEEIHLQMEVTELTEVLINEDIRV